MAANEDLGKDLELVEVLTHMCTMYRSLELCIGYIMCSHYHIKVMGQCIRIYLLDMCTVKVYPLFVVSAKILYVHVRMCRKTTGIAEDKAGKLVDLRANAHVHRMYIHAYVYIHVRRNANTNHKSKVHLPTPQY